LDVDSVNAYLLYLQDVAAHTAEAIR